MTHESDDWTVGRLLSWTTDFLRQRGASSPRLDAEVLLAAALSCERIQLYTAFGEIVADGPRAAFRDLVKRRAAGEPVAYLVGHREFYSLDFRVTRDVLIPRPETELLVLSALELLKRRDPAGPPAEVLDVGTGSGAIAVSLARYEPRCRVLGVDVSEAALAVARGNAETLGVADRTEFQRSDLLDSLTRPDWDLVVSNPPYVSESEFAALSAEIREYEPRAALIAGPTGTEVIARLIPQAAENLTGGGSLLLEISPMIEDAVGQLLRADGRFESPRTVKDASGIPRVIQARRIDG